jgi:hypothetical protein
MTATVTALRSVRPPSADQGSILVIRLLTAWDGIPARWVHFTMPTSHGAARVRATYRTLRDIGVSRTEARYAVVQILIAVAPDMTGGRP